MAEDHGDDQFFAVCLRALAASHRGGENVGGMRGVLLPVDVVVIHATDHQGIGKRGGNGVDAAAGTDDGGWATTCNFIENLEGNADIVLLVATESTADRVEKETLGLRDPVRG